MIGPTLPGAGSVSPNMMIYQNAIGRNTEGDLTIQLGAIYMFTEIGSPPALADFIISREAESPGSAVRLTWNPAVFTTPPRIYAMTGDGTGQYINDNSQSTWVLVFNGTDLEPNIPAELGSFSLDLANNGLLHNDQVGTGPLEVYYKAVATGGTLEEAPAVGKILNTAYGQSNYNMIGVPLVQNLNSTFLDVLSGAISKSGIEFYKFDNPGDRYVPAIYSGAWNTEDITLTTGDAAWIYNPLSEDLVLTIVGGVPSAEGNTSTVAVDVYGGGRYSMISNPYPQGGKLSVIGLEPLAGSEIYYFDNVAHTYVPALADGNAWDNDLFITPGTAMWYYRTGADLNWQTTIQ
ncbi:hypothetical protein ACFL1W_00310 [Candidatus Margulisiibacteriota bacterium]